MKITPPLKYCVNCQKFNYIKIFKLYLFNKISNCRLIQKIGKYTSGFIFFLKIQKFMSLVLLLYFYQKMKITILVSIVSVLSLMIIFVNSDNIQTLSLMCLFSRNKHGLVKLSDFQMYFGKYFYRLSFPVSP